MSSRENLFDDVDEVKQITIAGHDFDIRFPTLEEMEPIQKMLTEVNALRDKTDDEAVKKTEELDKKFQKALYAFVEPVGEHNDSIEKVLKTLPAKVSRRLNNVLIDMLKAE